ncbi:MAG TPA: HNH endonuclease signature motif containing protein [Verrucomicrobiae bacterium]|nr:HNH endonuclease signature motif containing protein [Verrucomicrobiae bacterium]
MNHAALPQTPEEWQEFIKSNVEVLPDGCWIWQLRRNTTKPQNQQYGVVTYNGKTANVHRVSYKVFHGTIPKGLVVRHICDVSFCVNPAHLLLGTRKDNAADMVRRNRFWHKLDPSAVATIREEYGPEGGRITHRELGDKNGVHANTVHKLLNFETWGHVEDDAMDTARKARQEFLESVGDEVLPAEQAYLKLPVQLPGRLGLENAREIRRRYEGGETMKEISRNSEFSYHMVWTVIRGGAWHEPEYTPPVKRKQGPRNPKLNLEQRIEIRQRWAEWRRGDNRTVIAAEYGVSPDYISTVIHELEHLPERAQEAPANVPGALSGAPGFST